MNITVRLDLSNFEKWLRDTPDKLSKAIQGILSRASFLVERQSKIHSPVDTGRLRSSIATDLRPMVATIQPHTNYAIYVHEGTRFMQGRPFMRQGLDEVQFQIQNIIDTEVEKVL